MATVAGNLVNASPIGDLTVWLLALDAVVVLQGQNTREVPLKDFYTGYKKIDRQPGEIVTSIYFRRPSGQYYFNFEKVSKRTYLSITYGQYGHFTTPGWPYHSRSPPFRGSCRPCPSISGRQLLF